MASNTTRPPAYFLSIGGPNSLFDTQHPSHKALSDVGKEINMITPWCRAILVVSAHWQSDNPYTLKINVAEDAGIIYDFSGFPKKFYEVKYPYRGSSEIAEIVKKSIESSLPDVYVEPVNRGLDHGVWAGFAIAFDTENNPLDIPIVQISLLGCEDVERHYKMGQALEGLRDMGILVIGAGMAVHNLNDYRSFVRKTGKLMPYSTTFDAALKEALTTTPERRWQALKALTEREDFREAHPTLEHALPFFITAGAAGPDIGEQIWTLPDGSLSWGQYRFGRVSKQT